MSFPSSPIYPYTSFQDYQTITFRADPTPAQCFCKTESRVFAAPPAELVFTLGNGVGIFYDAYECGAGCDMNVVPPLPGAVGSYSA